MLSLRPNMWLREGGVSAHWSLSVRPGGDYFVVGLCGCVEDILDRFGVY